MLRHSERRSKGTRPASRGEASQGFYVFDASAFCNAVVRPDEENSVKTGTALIWKIHRLPIRRTVSKSSKLHMHTGSSSLETEIITFDMERTNDRVIKYFTIWRAVFGSFFHFFFFNLSDDSKGLK